MTKYRADIDGLRAIAVGLVVLFHAGVPGLSGGFVGVDTFFVISGYLITDILWRELRGGTFSLARFYDRRARRILPALTVVLLVTAALGWALLVPGELNDLGDNVVASALAASNFLALSKSGYFAGNSQDNPLLHTWSLAIEEQFYLLWPLLLWGCWRLLRQRLWPVALLTIASLVASEWATRTHPTAAFYLLPARAWELSLGGLLATANFVPKPRSDLAAALVASGVGAIAAAAYWYDASTPFPGLMAAIPAGGAALVIAFGRQDNIASRCLAWKPLVWLGTRSYSLYLWHWPLLALARVHLNRPLSITEGLLAVGIAVVLAEASFRWIETPFRTPRSATVTWLTAPSPRRWRMPRSLSVGALTIALTVSLGGFLTVTRGGLPPERRAAAEGFETARHDTTRSRECHQMAGSRVVPASTRCTFGTALGPGQDQVLLWGDSHADHFRPALIAAVGDGLNVRQASKTVCPPILGDVLISDRGVLAADCATFNEAAAQLAISDPAITLVVLAARWAVYTEGRSGEVIQESEVFVTTREPPHERTRELSRVLLEQGLTATAKRLSAAGKRFLLLGQTPEFPFDVPSCLAREAAAGRSLDNCSVARTRVDARSERSERLLSTLAATYPGAAAMFPDQAFCTALSCPAVTRGVVLVRDHDHLTRSASLLLAPEFARFLPPPSGKTQASNAKH